MTGNWYFETSQVTLDNGTYLPNVIYLAGDPAAARKPSKSQFWNIFNAMMHDTEYYDWKW